MLRLRRISTKIALLLLIAVQVWLPGTGAWFRDGEDSVDNLLATATLDATLTSVDTGFVPLTIEAGGTAQRLITVRNVGSLPFEYELKPDFGNLSNPLCDALVLSFDPVGNVTGKLDPGLADEYVVEASLPDDASLDLINLSCEFDIGLLATQIEFPGLKMGFWDEEILASTVTASNWTPNVCSDITGYKQDDSGVGLKDWQIVIHPESSPSAEIINIAANDMDGVMSNISLDENRVYMLDVTRDQVADPVKLLLGLLDVTNSRSMILSQQAGKLEFEIGEPKPENQGQFTVKIFDVTDQIVTTNKDGKYVKHMCDPGSYRVVEVPQNGWEQVSPRSPAYTLTLPVSGEHSFVNKKKPVKIVINEVYYDVDDDHGDDGGGSKSDEWVELYNPNDFPVNLKKWALADNNKDGTLTNRNVYIPAHGFAVLAKAAETWKHWSLPESVITIEIGGVIGDLANAGDRVILKDSLGNEVDFVAWGDDDSRWIPAVNDVAEGHSIQRQELGLDTDTVNDWEDAEIPSPGTNPFSSVLVETQQQDNDLHVSFKNAAGFNRVKYFLSYERMNDEAVLVPDGTVPNETTKPELDLTLELEPIFLGTCTSNGICTPHLGVTEGIVNLMYFLDDEQLGSLTVPFSWMDKP